LSERGINAMRHSGQPKLLEHVMATTIPMRGRMIHGRRPNGALYEAPQDYDIHGRVRIALRCNCYSSVVDAKQRP
jgi:kynurenine 3-monooxygenase